MMGRSSTAYKARYARAPRDATSVPHLSSSPRGMRRRTSGRASRLSAAGACSSGTRYSPGSEPWNKSEDSGPGTFRPVVSFWALPLRALPFLPLLVSEPNSWATFAAPPPACPGACTPAARNAWSISPSAALGGVLHAAARSVSHSWGAVLREEEPGGEERQPCDDDQSVANRAHATLYGVRTWRAATASRPIWATSASRDGNVCTSRSRRTHSTVTVSPYSSPAKSNRWISRARAVMPNVGRGPWFIMPP